MMIRVTLEPLDLLRVVNYLENRRFGSWRGIPGLEHLESQDPGAPCPAVGNTSLTILVVRLTTDREDVALKKWIATYPCGCIGAVALEECWPQTRFVLENLQDGAVCELVTQEVFVQRGGVQNCKHDPQWGGVESEFADCPRCYRRMKKLTNGRLAAHKCYGRTCSQEPNDRSPV